MKRFKPTIRLGPVPHGSGDAIWGVAIEIDPERLFDLLGRSAILAKSGKTTALCGAIRAIAKKVTFPLPASSDSQQKKPQ